MSKCILSLILTAGAAWAADWADPVALREAIETIRRSEDFQPREAFAFIQRAAPVVGADAEARHRLAGMLLEAVRASDTTSLGRTTLAQSLALVAGDREVAALRLMVDDPSTAEAARIALRDVVGPPPPAESVENLRVKASSPDPAVRVAGLSALAHDHPAAAVPSLVGALRDSDPTVAGTAIRLLARLDAEALAREIPRLDAVRQAAVLEACAELRNPAVREAARGLLESADEATRTAAVRALGASGDAGDVARLAGLGADDALAQLAAPGTDDAILGQIASGTAVARMAAMRAAIARGMKNITSPLLAAAADADPSVRAEAFKALGRSGDISVYGPVLDTIGEGDSSGAVQAAKMIGRRIADPAARVEPIRSRLDAKDAPAGIQAALLSVLPAFGGDAALAPVVERMGSADDPLRDAAVRALVEWPDVSAVVHLYRVADDAASSVAHRTLAERALTRLAPVPPGIRALVYLNCGESMEAAGRGGVRLRVARGTAWTWGKGPKGTIATDPGAVRIEASGLKPGRPYSIGLSWWDFDNNGRAQSVYVGGRKVVETTRLPAWKDRKQPAVTVDLPVSVEAGADGAIAIEVRREAASNAVLSEIWIAEATGAAAAPDAAASPGIPAPEVRANAGAAKKVLIVTGEEHHDWRSTTPVLTEILARDPRLEVSVVEDPRALALPLLRAYDAIVLHYQNPRKGKVRPPEGALENLIRTVGDGTGLVLVHFASGAFIDWDTETIPRAYEKLAGRVWNPKLRPHDPRGPFKVRVMDRDHPATREVGDFDTDDELYTCLDGETSIRVLAEATSAVDGTSYPMVFVHTMGKGRVFHNALGHDVKALRVDAVGELYHRGAAWAAGAR